MISASAAAPPTLSIARESDHQCRDMPVPMPSAKVSVPYPHNSGRTTLPRAIGGIQPVATVTTPSAASSSKATAASHVNTIAHPHQT